MDQFPLLCSPNVTNWYKACFLVDSILKIMVQLHWAYNELEDQLVAPPTKYKIFILLMLSLIINNYTEEHLLNIGRNI